MSVPRLPPVPPEWVRLIDAAEWIDGPSGLPKSTIAGELVLVVRDHPCSVRHRLTGVEVLPVSLSRPHLPPGLAQEIGAGRSRIYVSNWEAADADWSDGTVGGWKRDGTRERLPIEILWSDVAIFARDRKRPWERQAAQNIAQAVSPLPMEKAGRGAGCAAGVEGVDFELIRQCVELRGALREATDGGAQFSSAAWEALAAPIIRTQATTDDGIVAKYELLQDIRDHHSAPELTKVSAALNRLLDTELRRANRDWKWLRLPPQRKRHKRIWESWQRCRIQDRRWLPLKSLVDFSSRIPNKKRHGSDYLDSWHTIYDALAADAFSIDGKSRVLFVMPAYACWRVSTKNLPKDSGPPEVFRSFEKDVVETYLANCWLPYGVAARWLMRFEVDLAKAIDPPIPEGGRALPPQAAAPVAPSDPAPSKSPNTGGRPRIWNWDAFAAELIRLANTPDGLPDRAATTKHMQKWCIEAWGKDPADSMIRDKIAKLYPDPH